MLINLRNALMTGKKSPLPPGARWVEYLESTGSQWIDTGVANSDNLVYEFTGCSTSNTTNTSLCGVVGTAGGSTVQRVIVYDSKYAIQRAVYSTTGRVNIPWDSSPHTFYSSKSLCKIDDVSSTGNFSIASDTQDTFGLFGTHRNSSGLLNSAKAKIYRFKMWLDTTLVRDFRPIAIGTTGYMLDLVSGEHLPYGNKGTGDFIIGPDIPSPV